MSDSATHGLQHARLPCPPPSPGACSNSCPSSRWCHPTIWSSVVPCSSCLPPCPASGSFLMNKNVVWVLQQHMLEATVLIKMTRCCWRRLWRVLWTARTSYQSILKLTLNIHWKDWCWSWSSSTVATGCKEQTHWKRPRCWERLRAGGEGDNRRWDGWMASLTQWTWVWVDSGSWWWTGRPGMLRFMGSQRVGHDWATEHILNKFLYASFATHGL